MAGRNERPRKILGNRLHPGFALSTLKTLGGQMLRAQPVRERVGPTGTGKHLPHPSSPRLAAGCRKFIQRVGSNPAGPTIMLPPRSTRKPNTAREPVLKTFSVCLAVLLSVVAGYLLLHSTRPVRADSESAQRDILADFIVLSQRESAGDQVTQQISCQVLAADCVLLN